MQFDFKKFLRLSKMLVNLNRTHNSNDTKIGYKILKKNFLNTKILNFKSGSSSNYWIVPKQWEVIHAKLLDGKKKVILDWKKDGPLSLFTFSQSYKGMLKWSKLRKHLLFDKKRPDSYLFHFRNQYRHWIKDWGFSIPYNKLKKIPKNQNFFVDIRTTFKNSHIQNSIQELKGSLNKSICFVSHFDHPGQLSDGLGACLMNNLLLEYIRKKYKKTNYTYLALSTIEIVGSHFFLTKYSKKYNIKEALSVNTVGINSKINYSKSFKKNSLIDRIILKISNDKNIKVEFSEFRSKMGADEIAFDSAGYNIPCGFLFRWPYDEYHSSKDNLSIVKKRNIEEFFNLMIAIIHVIESNYIPILKYKGLICLSNPKLDLYVDPNEMSNIKLLTADKKMIVQKV